MWGRFDKQNALIHMSACSRSSILSNNWIVYQCRCNDCIHWNCCFTGLCQTNFNSDLYRYGNGIGLFGIGYGYCDY
jgi:hypothetical protein